jgi:hypothetical protein
LDRGTYAIFAKAGSAEFAGFELRGLQTGNRRKAAEFLRIETLRYLAPAMGAGVTDHVWTIEETIQKVMHTDLR